MVREHQRLNGYEFEQTLGDSGEQRSLVGYSPWGRKESDTIEQLNNNNLQSTGSPLGHKQILRNGTNTNK